MRFFSRHMPRFIPTKPTWAQISLGALLCGATLAALGYALLRHPIYTLLAVVGVVVVSALLHYEHRLRLCRLARLRAGHSICEFRAAFDPRSVDPWVIRAVYEQLQAYLAASFPAFPLHAEDRLTEDLQIDGDDLSFNIAEEIAQRTGRALSLAEDCESTPVVLTAGDLVRYFNLLPKSGTAPA